MVSKIQVNDNEIHHVKVSRQGKEGTLQIDDGEAISGSSNGILAMLNVEGDIYLGE